MDKFDNDLNSLEGYLSLFQNVDQILTLYDQFPDFHNMELLNSESGKEIKLKINKEFEFEIEHELNAIPFDFLKIKLPNGDIIKFGYDEQTTQMSNTIISIFKLRYIDLQ